MADRNTVFPTCGLCPEPGHLRRDHRFAGSNVSGCQVCREHGRSDWAHPFESVGRNAAFTTADQPDRLRSCVPKIAYTTPDAARNVANNMAKRHPGEVFRAYRCRWDVNGNRHWHVGHDRLVRKVYQ